MARKKKYDYDEVMEILKDSYYTDYNGRVELLQDTFGMSKSEAEGWIDEWNMRPAEDEESSDESIESDDGEKPVDSVMARDMKDIDFDFVGNSFGYFDDDETADLYVEVVEPEEQYVTWVVIGPVKLDGETLYNVDIKTFDKSTSDFIDEVFEHTLPAEDVMQTISDYITK